MTRTFHRGARLGTLVLAVGLVAPVAAASEAPNATWLDGRADVLVRQAYLPSPRNIHGEFRLLERHGGTCAQTLLYTSSLRRALQRIRKKERRAWPDDVPGHEDSQRYLDALDAVRDLVLPQPGASTGLETMAIEFVLAEDVALFALYALDVTERDGRVEPGALRPLHVETVSREYASRAIQLMQDAAFRDAGQDDEDDENEEEDGEREP